MLFIVMSWLMAFHFTSPSSVTAQKSHTRLTMKTQYEIEISQHGSDTKIS